MVTDLRLRHAVVHVGFVFDLDRFLNNFLNTEQHFVSLLLAEVGVLLCRCAEEHELAHKSDLLLSDPVDLIFVAVLPLKLAKSLSHYDLVFLGQTGDHNFLHAVHHHLGQI